MDEKADTNLSDLVWQAGLVPRSSASLTPYFIVIKGSTPGTMLPLSSRGTKLGRSPDNNLQIIESSISRNHAQFLVDADGEPRLTDLGSTNGTFLNGNQITRKMPMKLRDGDRIQFGSLLVVKFVRLDPCEERFHREIFERAVRDGLTGLYKREYFLDQVGPLADRGALTGMGLAILMIDVDHFKRINDVYGHDTGDAVLRELAHVFRQNTGDEDLVARYGGEEFVVALPTRESEEAESKAESIRRALAETPLTANGHSLRATVSIGMAFAPAQRPKTSTALISSADQCLLHAKATGRNRVVSGVPVPTTFDDTRFDKTTDPRTVSSSTFITSRGSPS